MDYLALLRFLHAAVRPAAYLEIGVFTGASLGVSSVPSVGVDPAPALSGNAVGAKPWLKIYRMGSDDFFANHAKEHVLEGLPLELAFIDGLHLFEQVLRDFRNVEQWAGANALVAIHDVLPADVSWANREHVTPMWTGDVWRIVPCLRKHRPDLRLRVVSAAPSGVLLVGNLDPRSTLLAECEAEIVEEFLGDPRPYEEQFADYLSSVDHVTPDQWLSAIEASLDH